MIYFLFTLACKGSKKVLSNSQISINLNLKIVQIGKTA